MPLRQLHPDPSAGGSNAGQVDIIAVHGLNPRNKKYADHAWDTWRKPEGSNGRLWLREDLPQHTPDARIFLYVYNSMAVFGNDRSTFMDKATEFLEAIRMKREDATHRPLVLLGHSLGGLLIEQALINAYNNPKYTHILNATNGLAFFGTPHRGGNKFFVNVGDIAAKIAIGMGLQKGDNLLEILKNESIVTDILQEHWRHLLLRFNIVSFWGSMDNAVSRDSAWFGLPGLREHIVKLDADHNNICRFGESESDRDNFDLVCRNIKDLYVEAWKSVQKRAQDDSDVTESIKKWLPSCDFEEKQNNIISSCLKSIGQWLLDHEAYKCWIIGGRPWNFRLHGKEGTGKTVLSSIVIDHLQQQFQTKTRPVIYLYLDKMDPTTHVLENLFGSLLKQLLQLNPHSITPELRKSYQNGKSKAKSWQEIFKLLETEILTYDRVYLIVDALYECLRDEPRKVLEDQLVKLQRLHPEKLCLMITGKDSQERIAAPFCDECGKSELRIYFHCDICDDGGFDLCQTCRDKGVTCKDKSHTMFEPSVIEVEMETRDSDIEQYIKSRIDDNGQELWDKRIHPNPPSATVLGRECRKDPECLQTIVSTITEKAEGILLFARLYMDRLEHAKNRKGIDIALDNLPTGLDEVYAAAIRLVQNQEDLENRGIALSVLALVTQARRPLSLKELLHVLTTEPGDTDFEQAKSYDKPLILSATNGLINISDYDEIVRVYHSSLYLYLDKTLDTWFPNAKIDMAQRCLTYLSWDPFSKPAKGVKELDSRKENYPFISYASQYWGDHVRDAESNSSTDEMATRFLDESPRVTASIQAAWSSNSWGIAAWDVYTGVVDLHVCAWFGLSSVLFARLEKGTDLQIDILESTYKQTPLMYACRRGQVEMARQLLDRGADINLVSDRGRTALLEATMQNQNEVVEILLERQDLEIDAVNTKEHDRTALMLAAYLGQSNTVDSLLTHAAEPNLQDAAGFTALHLAVNAGHVDTVKALLKTSKVDVKIDIDIADRVGRTPLIIAAMRKNCDVVKLLLQNHADPSIGDKQGGGSAILRAIEYGSIEVVTWMLDNLKVADIQCLDDDDRGILHAASVTGNAEMVKLVARDERIDLDEQDKYGRTPLHGASEESHLEVVQTLIEYGADTAIEDHFDRTPLTIALQYGWTQITDILLGDNKDQQANSHQTVNAETSPIWLLVKIGRADLVSQSITNRKGDLCEKEPISNNTALHSAVLCNNVDLLRILLENDESGPNPINRHKRTPLHLAAVNDFLEATKVLLDYGADVDVEDQWRCTPLYLARWGTGQSHEHFPIAIALIEAGADTNSIEVQEMFFAAVELGSIAAVQILMNKGAYVLDRNDKGQTAFELARDTDNTEMMEIVQPKTIPDPKVESGRRVRHRRKILPGDRAGRAGQEA